MFSFFRKKPPAAETPASAETRRGRAPPWNGSTPTSASCSSARSPPKRRAGVAASASAAAAGRRRLRLPAVIACRRRRQRRRSAAVPATASAELASPPSPRRHPPSRSAKIAATGWPSCGPGCARPARASPRSSSARRIDDAMYEDLEAALLLADAGVAATRHLLDDLQRRVKRAHLENPAAVRGLLADCIADLLAPLERPLTIGEHVPTVIMVVGVNGAGKTTSVGKLTRHLVDADQKVLLAAADTFRAAAREQLLAWAERAEPARDGAPARPGTRRQPGRDRQPGRRRSRRRDLRCGRRRPRPRLRRRHRRHRRPPGDAVAPDGRAEEDPAHDRQGRAGRAARGAAGDRRQHRAERARPGAGLRCRARPDRPRSSPSSTAPPRAACWRRSRSGRARGPRRLPVYFIGVGEKLADLQTFRAREFAQALLS